jgi:hypothetical protein
MDSGAAEQNGVGVDLVNACGNRRETSDNASVKLTVNASLVMACGFACSSSAFIVPSHDSDRISALAGKQMKGRITNSIRDISATALNPHVGQPHSKAEGQHQSISGARPV